MDSGESRHFGESMHSGEVRSGESSDADSFPWPPRHDRGFIASFAATWRESTFQPQRFYRAMPADGLWPAALYYLLIGIIAEGARLFWGNIFAMLGVSGYFAAFGNGEVPTAAERLANFLFSPIWLLAALFLASAVIHLMVLMLVPDRRPFTATARVLAFSYSPLLFTVVPFVGSAVGGIWSVVLAVIGVREVHRTTTGRAIAAILLPLAIAAFIGMMLAFVVGLLGLQAIRSAG